MTPCPRVGCGPARSHQKSRRAGGGVLKPLERDKRPIAAVAGVLLLLTIVHDLDHVRQGRSLDTELYGVGTLSLVAAALTVALALRRHPFARQAGVVLGTGTVLGVIAVHVAPTWWPLSDSYGEAGVDMISWAIILAMILVGAVLAIVSARAGT